MGLTIHYLLSTGEPLSEAAVRDLATRGRAFALESAVDSVSRLLHVGPDFPLAHPWVAVKQVSGGETLWTCRRWVATSSA